MVNFYLDIETHGKRDMKPHPDRDEIITIQYQKLSKEGKPIEDLVILKSWESSEEDIIKKFYEIFVNDNVFEFLPIGFNLIYELSFLYTKFKKYNLPLKSSFMDYLLEERPIIDLSHSFKIANNLEFKGYGLDKMTNKKTSGKSILDWYENKEYDKIEEYIRDEAKSFLDVLQIVKEDLNLSKKKWTQK
jgi:hypothetical protein